MIRRSDSRPGKSPLGGTWWPSGWVGLLARLCGAFGVERLDTSDVLFRLAFLAGWAGPARRWDLVPISGSRDVRHLVPRDLPDDARRYQTGSHEHRVLSRSSSRGALACDLRMRCSSIARCLLTLSCSLTTRSRIFLLAAMFSMLRSARDAAIAASRMNPHGLPELAPMHLRIHRGVRPGLACAVHGTAGDYRRLWF